MVFSRAAKKTAQVVPIARDVVEHIVLPFCDFVTLYNMQTCSKSFHQMVQRHRQNYKPVLRRIEAFLRTQLRNFDTRFKPALLASQGVISGSCLIHAIHPDLPFRDIDVYVTRKMVILPRVFAHNIPTPLYRYAQDVEVKTGMIETNEEHPGALTRYDERNLRELAKIVTVRDYWYHPTKRLQFITYEEGLNPWNQIMQTFDLNVCVNMYDGRRVVLHYVPALVNRHITPRGIFPFTVASLSRVRKYENRGFQLVDPSNIVGRYLRERLLKTARELQHQWTVSSQVFQQFLAKHQLTEADLSDVMCVEAPVQDK